MDDGTQGTTAMDSQPVAIVEAVKLLVQQVLAAAVLFGLALSDAQALAVLGCVGAALALVTLLVVPRRVNTNATLENARKDAYLTGAADAKEGTV